MAASTAVAHYSKYLKCLPFRVWYVLYVPSHPLVSLWCFCTAICWLLVLGWQCSFQVQLNLMAFCKIINTFNYLNGMKKPGILITSLPNSQLHFTVQPRYLKSSTFLTSSPCILTTNVLSSCLSFPYPCIPCFSYWLSFLFSPMHISSSPAWNKPIVLYCMSYLLQAAVVHSRCQHLASPAVVHQAGLAPVWHRVSGRVHRHSGLLHWPLPAGDDETTTYRGHQRTRNEPSCRRSWPVIGRHSGPSASRHLPYSLWTRLHRLQSDILERRPFSCDLSQDLGLESSGRDGGHYRWSGRRGNAAAAGGHLCCVQAKIVRASSNILLQWGVNSTVYIHCTPTLNAQNFFFTARFMWYFYVNVY